MANTITHKGEPRPLPDTLRNSHLMRYDRLGGKLKNFAEQPATESIILACALLDLKGDPAAHADDLPPVFELVETLSPLIAGLGEKKSPAAGASPSPVPGTPGA